MPFGDALPHACCGPAHAAAVRQQQHQWAVLAHAQAAAQLLQPSTQCPAS